MRSGSKGSRRVVLALALVGCWATALACGSFQASEPEVATEAGADGSPEGAVEAAPADSGDAGRFCAHVSDAAFCADFDVGELGAGFTPYLNDAGSLVRIDSTQSPPSALLSIAEPTGKEPPPDAAPTDFANGAAAALLVNLARPFGSAGAALDLDVRIDELPIADGGFAALLGVGIVPDTQVVTVVASAEGMGLLVADPAVPKGAALVLLAPTSGGGWMHMRLEVSFVGAGTRIFVNNVSAATTKFALSSNASGYYLQIGLVTQAVNRSKVAYDNVVVTQL